jgi:hypothetical protein
MVTSRLTAGGGAVGKENRAVIFVGDDWSQQHHDIEIHNEAGGRLSRNGLPEGIAGIAELHALVAEHANDPGEVVVGMETDRGLRVAALVAVGYDGALRALANRLVGILHHSLNKRVTNQEDISCPAAEATAV